MIIICKNYKEYSQLDYSLYNLIFVYFAIQEEPQHTTPIIRLITSLEDAGLFSFSSYAATNGWSQENFPRCDDHEIIEFGQKYLNGEFDEVSIFKKFKNFTKAIIKRASGGFVNVPANIEASRLESCSKCPFLIEGECSLCGCPVAAKVKWASEACPDIPSRWGVWKEGVPPKSVVAPLESKVSATGGKGAVCLPCAAKNR